MRLRWRKGLEYFDRGQGAWTPWTDRYVSGGGGLPLVYESIWRQWWRVVKGQA